jgi:flagellar biosynthesis activator protein FlaF
MYHFTYGEIVEDAGSGTRERERLALDKSIDLLREASGKGGGNKAVLEALIYVRRLWSLLLEDLAQPGNDLPVKLRADLISIGFWIMKEADRVRDDQSRSLKGLIDVSSIIRDGLK